MWPIAGAMIGAAVGQGVGGFMAQRQQEKMMHQQMDYQTWMAANAHQLEVADLRKAGLNPILSGTGGGGASGGSVSAPSAINPLEGAAGTLASTAKMLGMEYDKNRAEVNLTNNLATEALTRADNNRFVNSEIVKRIEQMDENIALLKWQGLNAGLDFRRRTAELPRTEAIGEVWKGGKDLVEGLKEHGGDWLKSLGNDAIEYLKKKSIEIQDMLKGSKLVPDSKGIATSGATPQGGQSRAGQKVPWKEVEKQRGSENAPDWSNVPLVPSEHYKGGKR